MEDGKGNFLERKRLGFFLVKVSDLALIEGTISRLLVKEFDERKRASMSFYSLRSLLSLILRDK